MRRRDLLGLTPEQLKHRAVCAEHFEIQMFMNSNERKKLIHNAIPTIINAPNPPTQSASKRPPPKERTNSQPAKKCLKMPEEVKSTIQQSIDEDQNSESPNASTSHGSHETPTKNVLRRKNQNLKMRMSRLKRKLLNPNRPRTQRQKIDDAINSVSKVVTGPALEFIKTQIKSSARKKRGYRWSNDEIQFALTLFHSSPKCYRILVKSFALPAVRTLRRAMQNIQIYPGFHESILAALKEKVGSMSEKQKLCALVFDEMSIKEHLSYNAQTDRIEGFENLGTFGSSDHIANHAGVFMIRGIIEKWKQAVGYFLTSGPVSGKTLKDLTLSCVTKLQDIGLHVVLLICDQGSNNMQMIKKLGVSAENPFFMHNDKKVFVTHDPPHLIKNIRNNFKKSGFIVDTDTIKWEYVEQFQKFNSSMSIKLAPKLTERHITIPPFSAMRVRLATQVLSHSVAAGIATLCELEKMESDARPTAEFIEHFDSLFDVFNSRVLRTSKKMRSAVTPSSEHHTFLRTSLDWLQKIKQAKNGKTLPCLTGWRLAINCLLNLWSHLNTQFGVSFLLTSRLNQDCIENFFSQIRNKGGNRDNPDAVQFRAAYRAIAVDSIFVLSSSSNCEEDIDTFILKLRGLQQFSDPSSATAIPAHIAEIFSIANNTSVSLPEENVAVYIGGYLIKKAKKRFRCQRCFSIWENIDKTSTGQDDKFVFLEQKKFDDSSNLTIPSDNIINFVTECETVFNNQVQLLPHSSKLCSSLTTKMMICDSVNNITCQAEECENVKLYLVGLYNSIKINQIVRDQNQSLKSVGQRRNRKLLKLQHL